ncbi:DUF2325 domain-containing protein [Desulfobaculum bizertense]|uniref:DUF2325 domain-containing protein n=1 Tax=Desulfobaculum bizertense DSM 18034 TaxID=1121442 RepID=A0A1T4VCK4_9BACT|nr:DUF2325 domain-containing protein [Desulfobaculum bizertense]UIJ37566.1 DUF2325 domain-containing protein [Desulfobaculum bizertense]SKA62692.1 hypothetical protein SAMN02745702_00004 [Desulfobaculum bizertense DSM 18034]
MCAVVVGGMDRLKRDYIDTAKRLGIRLKVFTGKENVIAPKMGQADLIVLFTNQVSHKAKKEVVSYAKANDIQLHMSHSCGISTLRSCLSNA